MSIKGKKKHLPNGCYSNEDWIRLVSDEKAFESYQRNFSTAKGGDKCPPIELTDDGACYYCEECSNHCAGYVKEYKKHYMIKNQKYLKTELEADVDESS